MYSVNDVYNDDEIGLCFLQLIRPCLKKYGWRCFQSYTKIFAVLCEQAIFVKLVVPEVMEVPRRCGTLVLRILLTRFLSFYISYTYCGFNAV